ncbi:MAG TPA: hydantoinase/oxoprolinase family protein [Methylomirabilota bacterium]|nr:hydantoinase/oxoprolinase family protein [Methylomirabilota bacterium]
MYRIGIDVGGTFTDLVAVDPDGRVTIAKATSTPEDQSLGVVEGLTLLARELGLDLHGLLGATDLVVHGTTVATNALLERKGAAVGMLTTEGHRDIIEMREGLKDDRYNLRMPPPIPLVPRARRLGVRERIRFDGKVATPLDRRSLEAGVGKLKRAGIASVAVCYLHAYANARHEQATRRALERLMPGVYISLSSEVLPQIKEYERFGTTVVNAYVGPILGAYLGRLEQRLRGAGYARDILIMQSHGGVAGVADSVRLAAGAVLSGPAGGIAGGRHAARVLSHGELITFDMGGTSTDIALLQGGEPQLTGDKAVGPSKVALPAIDIHTLGAGGGSIARVDEGGILHVGPESAGAVPGPACYGLGGTAATVTDANVVLGFLDPANFLGGRTRLETARAEAAVAAIASRLGTLPVAAAEGIQRVVNTNMAEGIRIVSVRRGADPRRFALLAFGGAAGLHVTEVARMLEISRVVVPRVAAVLSAWGMLATDLRHELVRTHVGEARKVGGARLRALFAEMEARGRARLGQDVPGHVDVRRAVDMRYGEQTFEITVPLEGVDVNAPDLMDQVIDRFHKRHEELYTYSAPGQDVVLVNARLAVVGTLGNPPADRPVELGPGASAPPRSRLVYLGRWAEVPVYDFEAARPGLEVKGPAIFESATTTVVLRQDDRAIVTPRGWLDIKVSGT